MRVILVPTTHWDREWYRTFQAFRSRLVDTVDRVLELLASDDGYTFLLDGQTIVLEDYLEVRPQARAELERHIEQGRVEIGPWYVQPDSFLPSGEAHIRNLLEGRRVGEMFGPVTRVAYTPDSFGHPAQFPQIFAGFSLGQFIYWRGNSDEISELPAEYAWRSPDGSTILACHLWLGYGNAAGLPHDLNEAVDRLRRTVNALSARTTSERVLLLAGTDHQPPDPHTAAVCEALASATGWEVSHGSLTDFVEGLSLDGRPGFTGELMGGRIANLLPGVWSTRTYLKLLNRRSETALEAWAEPWAALGGALGCADERPALRSAWRQLLQNQAHDSICGCSQDAVHEQMLARYDASRELASETARRVTERLAGLDVTRRVPWSTEIDIAVFNPSPHVRTDVVRFPLQGFPPYDQSQGHFIHPLNWANMRTTGFEVAGLVDGREPDFEPARLVPVHTHDRVRIINEQDDHDVEFVAEGVPAFGYKRYRLRESGEHPDAVDDGTSISAGDVSVDVNGDGTLDVTFGEQRFAALLGLEDIGDRGDTYDFDPVPGGWSPREVTVSRSVHPNGLQRLSVKRSFDVPALSADRSARTQGSGSFEVRLEVGVVPGVRRLDVLVEADNRAEDHRVQMLFPTGSEVETFLAATTLDVATRSSSQRDGSAWLHPAPSTFPHQGWVSANGLTVVAPGLPEAEVRPDGTIAITLVRSVGWLSRMDLKTRPTHAGPALPTPGAQCLRRFEARLSLLPGPDARAARDAETGLMAVVAGDAPLLGPGRPLLALDPHDLVLSALKPAESGGGLVVRVLNPTDNPLDADLRLGLPATSAQAVKLDETPGDFDVDLLDGRVRFPVPPHALRSVRLS